MFLGRTPTEAARGTPSANTERAAVSVGPLSALLLLLLLFVGAPSLLAVDAERRTFRPSPVRQGTVAFDRRSNMPTVAASASSRTTDSSVLKELKDRIREQSEEIAQLKKQIRATSSGGTADKPPSSAGAVSHGGHGGGDVSAEDVADYMSVPFYRQAFRRVAWLGIFLGSLALTALIMNGFEHTLEKNIELAYFVPMLAGHGGNTGGQTVGTILSALSTGAVNRKDAPAVIRKEAMTGVMSGVMLSVVVAPIAHYVMGISKHVSTVLLFALPVVSTIAATLGSAIPFLCVFLGLDPSVIAAPAMTSFVDVTGLISYFMLANRIFALFGLEL